METKNKQKSNDVSYKNPVPDLMSDGMRLVYKILGSFLSILIIIVWVVLFFKSAQHMNVGRYFAPVVEEEFTRDRKNIFVSDNAHLLNAKTKEKILELNKEFEKLPQKPQLMVITVKSIPNGEDITTYANQVATKYGVGDKKEDSGLVYLIAEKERKARLEVGYGLEGIIPDALALDIIDQDIPDYYKVGDYNKGVQLVASRIKNVLTDPAADYKLTRDLEQGPFAYLNTPQKSAIWFVVLVLLTMLLWYVRKFSAYFKARLQTDELARHYFADMKLINPELPDQDILLNKPEAQATRAELKQKIQALPVTQKSDYYDMDFAFGKTNPTELFKNARDQDPKFRLKSMYRQHQNDWYGNNFFSFTDRYPANDPRNYSMNLPKKIIWHLLKFFTSKLFWISFFLIGVFGPDDFEGNILLFRIPKDFLVMAFEASASLLSPESSFWQVVFPVGLLIMMFLTFFAGSKIHLFAIRKFRLDRIYHQFLADLKQYSLNAPSKEALPEPVQTNEYLENIPEKKSLQMHLEEEKVYETAPPTKLNPHGIVPDDKKQQILPDYYDFAFAFGWLTAAEFLMVNLPSARFKLTSVYRNHRDDWYRHATKDKTTGSYRRDDDNNSDNHSSGSSDSSSGSSFGGGSFGGGGATSGW